MGSKVEQPLASVLRWAAARVWRAERRGRVAMRERCILGDRKRTTIRWSGGRKGTASQYR